MRYTHNKLILSILAGMFLLISITSCIKFNEFDNNTIVVDYEGQWAIPLFNTTATIGDVMDLAGDLQYVNVDENGFIYLQALEDFSFFPLHEVNQHYLVKQNVNSSFEYSAQIPEIPIYIQDTTIQISFDIAYNINEIFDDENDVILLSSPSFVSELLQGSLVLMFDIDSPFGWEITMSTENFIAPDGTPYCYTFNNNNYANNVNLKDWSLLVPSDSVFFNGNLKLTLSGPQPQSDFNLFVSFGFENLMFKKLAGYIAYIRYYNSDGSTFDIFSDFPNITYDITFGNAIIDMDIVNSIGLGVNIIIDTLMISDGVQNRFILEPGTTVHCDAPEIYGQTASGHAIVPVLGSLGEIMPDRYYYSIKLEMTGSIDEISTIAYTDSIYVNGSITIPLEMQINSITYYDTIVIDAISFETDVDVTGEVILSFENSIPFNIDAQVFIADSLLNITDSIITDNSLIIAAPEIGGAPNFFVEEPSITNLTFPFSNERFSHLKSANYLILRTFINTPPQSMMRIYTDQYLTVRGGIKVAVEDFNINPNSNE
jgi:hypothetical protein